MRVKYALTNIGSSYACVNIHANTGKKVLFYGQTITTHTHTMFISLLSIGPFGGEINIYIHVCTRYTRIYYISAYVFRRDIFFRDPVKSGGKSVEMEGTGGGGGWVELEKHVRADFGTAYKSSRSPFDSPTTLYNIPNE